MQRTGEALPARESRSPELAGLDAGARGFADYTTPDADSLLTWYRTGGRSDRQAVEMYLARRAIAAAWECSALQAMHVIHEAMLHVLIPPCRRGAPTNGAMLAGMRKKDFHRLRAMAGAWLRAGIMDAVYRYGMGLE